jgi:dCMP deaminase
MLSPDTERPTWLEMGMLTAKLWALRSPDPNTKVGAVIFDKHNCVIGIGYNSFPRGCCIHLLPWDKTGELHETKYAYVQHAERNAILNATIKDLKGSSLFTTLYPCNDCAGLIIQVGIKKVYYSDNKYCNTSSCIASKKMFELAGVDTQQIIISQKTEEILNSWINGEKE